MGQWLKIDFRRVAPAFDLQIVGRIAFGHAGVRNVGDADLDLIDPRLDRAQFFVPSLDAIRKRLHLGDDFAGVLLGLFHLRHFLGDTVLFGAAGLHPGDDLAAGDVPFQQAVHIRLIAFVCNGLADNLRVLANIFQIQHI